MEAWAAADRAAAEEADDALSWKALLDRAERTEAALPGARQEAAGLVEMIAAETLDLRAVLDAIRFLP